MESQMPEWAVINSLEGDELENLWQKNIAARKLTTKDSFLLNVDSQRYFHKATVDWREYNVPCPIWNSGDNICLICQGCRLGRTKEEAYRATDLCTTLKEKSDVVTQWRLQNTIGTRPPKVTFDIPSVASPPRSLPKCAFCDGVELVKELGLRCSRCTQLSDCCWDCKSSGNTCRACSAELNNI
jgi:hypothetical protein